MKRPWIGALATWAALSVSIGPVDAEVPVVPGASVVGLENSPGGPDTSGGRDVVQVLEASSAVGYGGGASNAPHGFAGSGVGHGDAGAEPRSTGIPPPPTPHGVRGVLSWKDHSSPWPEGALVVGGHSYTREVAVALLDTPVGADMTYALLRQTLAASLNVLDGNESDCVTGTIMAANEWLIAHPVGSGVKARSSAWTTLGVSLADILEQYNAGNLCGAPGG